MLSSSCVGVTMKGHYEGMPSLDGHKLLLRAMHECHVDRLIDWATPSVPFQGDKKSLITLVPGFLAGIIYRQAKAEIVAIGKVVAESGLDWTLVRFIAPRDTPYTGKVKISFGDVKMRVAIGREDIGAFMVEQVENKRV